MLENYYEELKIHKNPRQNLSLLRSEVKENAGKQALLELLGDGALLTGLLSDEDPKVRKNAALLIGDLGLARAGETLLRAYQQETTLFVKSAYLTALEKVGAAEYIDTLKAHLARLTGMEPAEEEKKHVDAQIRELEKIITGVEGISHHTFTGFQKEHEILLATNREQREVTLGRVEKLPADVRRSMRLHPLGVAVSARELAPYTRIRTYREILFFIHPSKKEAGRDPLSAAAAVWNSDMPGMLREFHREGGPFYFRLELKARLKLDKKTIFAKRFAAELERLSGRALVNSTSEYELEIRLIENRDGSFVPFFKLRTIPMKRFSYRKNAISASIHPALAAMLVELSRPWMKEDAQILDPFCGVGTMLIERDINVHAREMYGTDIFGDAVRMARENAAAAGREIHFINRDYFDFSHAYAFDEIITNMPVRGRKTKEEMDAFYAAFFEKSKELLVPGSVVILYSNEAGFVKKYLRLCKEFGLIREFCIREKEQFFLYVIGFKIG